mmetsp:Transcript_10828/g.21547  ORF Transcript_10828/g.21547 Transcript_10828/m.21547 type:complete len:415 (-) Transcript_10828:176-1420(-)
MLDNEESSLLFWCLEALCDAPQFPRPLFLDLVNRLPPDALNPPGSYPESLKYRMVVNGLKRDVELNMDTLGLLDSLTTLVKQWEHQGLCPKNVSSEDLRILCPTSDLVLNVKTALVAEFWTKNPTVSSSDALQFVYQVFGAGSAIPPAHQPRFEECLMAATQEDRREYINRIVSGTSVVGQVQAFAESCLDVLGKPAIRVVLGDIASGGYPIGKFHPNERISDLAMREPDSPGKALQLPEESTPEKKNMPAEDHYALMEILNSMSPQQNDDFKSKVESLITLVQQQSDDSERKQARAAKRAMLSQERKSPKTKRRPNRRWTDREVRALKKGCMKHGVGHWSEILREHANVLSRRNQVDLKDKWRNMIRNPDEEVRKILEKEKAAPKEDEEEEDGDKGAKGEPEKDANNDKEIIQ